MLVNEGTGSAAELLAGALQDSGRAVVVGTPTFGKGLVHSFFPIADGAVVAVTVGQLRTPREQEILGVAQQGNYMICNLRDVYFRGGFTLSTGEPTSRKIFLDVVISSGRLAIAPVPIRSQNQPT